MERRTPLTRIHSPGSPRVLAENVVIAFMAGLVAGFLVTALVLL